MSDNDIFYLLGDNTLGGDGIESEYEVWILLVDGLFWHVAWSAEEADEFIRVNDKPDAPVKLMYRGTVGSVV